MRAVSEIGCVRDLTISETARILHGDDYSDDRLLIVRHEGSDHDAISGRLGYWRGVRVREDRGPPRHVAWEPLPRRVRAKKGHTKEKAVGDRASQKNAPTAAPGAGKAHSLGAIAHAAGGTRSYDGRDLIPRDDAARRDVLAPATTPPGGQR